MVSSPVAYLTPAQKLLDFGLTEPQNPNLQVSEVEKYKVEHLAFMKYQKNHQTPLELRDFT